MKYSKLMKVFITAICFYIVVTISFAILLYTRVRGEYTIEEGQSLSASDVRRYSWDRGSFVWLIEPDTSAAGITEGKVQAFPLIYTVTVVVKPSRATNIKKEPPSITEVVKEADTKAPIVTTHPVVLYATEAELQVSPEDFIQSVTEESEYTALFLTKPDLSHYGEQKITIQVYDKAGNQTEAEATLLLLNIKSQLEWNVGEELPLAEDFLAFPGSDISYITDINELNGKGEGTYPVTLLVDGIETSVNLIIKDMEAPVLVLLQKETWKNKKLEVTQFIDLNSTTDNSGSFTAVFDQEPDWSLPGEQEVAISITDASGNCASATTIVWIKKDEKAPVVTVTNIDVQVGKNISYKKAVNYYDDVDTKEEMQLSIERTGVNLNQVGTYEVTYTVTDCSGNATSVIGKINVLEEAPKWEDEEAIHEKAREVLAKIINDDMTDREKAQAIYRWVKNNIWYVNHSEKGNYMRGAYEGLLKKEGDCFVYAATAKELLTIAGIPNIDIVKSTKNPSHYWNLVYIEDGWYHFDTTPRKDKSEFFLLTDAELEDYSSKHRNTHCFDRSLYPEIK